MTDAVDHFPATNRGRSFSPEQVEDAYRLSRILNYEKEVAEFALAFVEKAEAEGLIVESARDKLLDKYNTKLHGLEKQLFVHDKITRLNELEDMKSNLVYMFSNTMGNIHNNVEDIKTLLALPRKQTSPEKLSHRTRGVLGHLFIVLIVITLLVATSSYAFGFLFNQSFLTHNLSNQDLPDPEISNRSVTSSTGITASVDVGIYLDNMCESDVTFIDWGIVYPDDNITYHVYLRNLGNVECTLQMNTSNWDPLETRDLIAVTWDYKGNVIEPGEVIQVTLYLSTTPQLENIPAFSFDVVITSMSTE